MRFQILCFLALVFTSNFCIGAGDTTTHTPSFIPRIGVVKEIKITGNEKTKDQTIIRELTVAIGDTIFYSSPSFEAERSKRALVNLNLFNSVSVHFATDTGYAIRVEVVVEEKWYIWPLPFLEFADRNFNQWYDFDLSPDRTNFGLYFFKYNNFGRNQTLKIGLVGGYTDNVSIEYRVPYFPKAPKWGVTGKIARNRNHEIWLTSTEDKLRFFKYNNEDMIKRFSASAKVVYRPWRTQDFVSLESQFFSVEVADTITKRRVFPSYLTDNQDYEQFMTTTVTLEHERRNNKLFPTNGNHFKVSIAERFGDGKHQNFTFDLEASTHFWTSRHTSVSLGVQAHHTTLSAPAYLLLPALGYNRLVRGFENFVITGESYVVTKSHFKWNFYRDPLRFNWIPIKAYQKVPVQMYASAHCDFGYIDNSAPHLYNWHHNTALVGYGAGIDMLFWMEKLIRLEYSFTNIGTNGLFLHFKKAF